MKKFLSLVLAMIMTLSLVTISAGATEYKDLTDKDEIQYEEAVAVLNRIGVITGYEDGTFRPETELTRGAAAKIIVSLMIGPDAANALPNTTSPYPDVPAGHTFAGVISYCKTAEYISGYGDGTFRPAGTLTGYAFAKMLLGALGYKSNIEGFVDTGWTNNVARVGNVAGLFDRISFDGSAAVTRDQACQLALNTLKGTLVTYGGTTIINGGTAGQMTMQGTTANPVTSNNRDINANIGRKDWYGGNNQGSDYLTLEFGEEHFKDLRLEHDRYDPAHDDFGRPSNEWSYKKVTIGTFPLPADFTYTTQVAHWEDTDANKEKALGLRNYDLIADGGYSYWTGTGSYWDSSKVPNYIQNNGFTNLWLNGLEQTEYFKTKDSADSTKYAYKVADIADFTDNGTLVEVYVSYVDADWITDVVVIQTQLMEVDKVASDYVSLKLQDSDNDTREVGYNQPSIHEEIINVKDNNEECYPILKDLKSGDDIAVVPVTTDGGKTYEAAEVYVPETVSGTWTKITTYGKLVNNVSTKRGIAVTVGGTEYKIADWNAKMIKKDEKDIKATRTDVTLLMDKYGNALKAKGIGDTSGFMVIGNYYQSLVNGKISTFVHGWDINGTELDLNLGSNVKFQNHNSQVGYGHELGELVTYSSADATGDADYALTHENVHSVFPFLHDGTILADTDVDVNASAKFGYDVNGAPNYEAKANNLRLPLSTTAAAESGETTPVDGDGKPTVSAKSHFCDPASILADIDNNTAIAPDGLYKNFTYEDASKVKFIYVNYTEGEDEVDSVEFKTGRQNADYDELIATLPGQFIYAAQASVKDGEKITSVVIKRESSDASLNRMLYVIKYNGFNEYDASTGKTGIGVTVARFTADGKYEDEVDMVVDKNLAIGAFATYSDLGETTINGKTVDHYYHVKSFNKHNTNPSVVRATGVTPVSVWENGAPTQDTVKYLLRLNDAYKLNADGKPVSVLAADDDGAAGPSDGKDATDNQSYLMSDWRSHDIVDNQFVDGNGILWTSGANFLNMSTNKAADNIDDTEDLLKFMKDNGVNVDVTVLFNEKPDSDDFRVAYLIVINRVYTPTTTLATPLVALTKNYNGANAQWTFGANVSNAPANATVHYQWKKSTDGGNTWVPMTAALGAVSGINGATLVVDAAHVDIAADVFTCEVWFESTEANVLDSAKTQPAVGAGAVEFEEAPEIASVNVTYPASFTRGEPATFTATAKDAANQEITNVAYQWGYLNAAGKFVAFTEKNLPGVDATSSTLEVEDAADVAGKQIVCMVTPLDATGVADETKKVDPADPEAPVEITQTVTNPDTGEEEEVTVPPTEAETVPPEAEMEESEEAETAVVSFEIGDNMKVVFTDAHGTSTTLTSGNTASARTITVNKGDLITVAVSRLGEAKGLVNVDIPENMTHGEPTLDAGTATYANIQVNSSGTITVEEVLDLTALAATVTRGNLHDCDMPETGEGGPTQATHTYTAADDTTDLMNDSYKVTGRFADGTLTIAFQHGGLKNHFNADDPKMFAYWVGFWMNNDAATTGWAIKKYQVTGYDEEEWTGGSANAGHQYMGFKNPDDASKRIMKGVFTLESNAVHADVLCAADAKVTVKVPFVLDATGVTCVDNSPVEKTADPGTP